jgi:hypothetical protein
MAVPVLLLLLFLGIPKVDYYYYYYTVVVGGGEKNRFFSLAGVVLCIYDRPY